jgi:hypothetical protein
VLRLDALPEMITKCQQVVGMKNGRGAGDVGGEAEAENSGYWTIYFELRISDEDSTGG